MTWSQAEKLIRSAVKVGSGILKCDGLGCRTVTAHTTDEIAMRTGVKTEATKAITYAMLRHAFDTLQANGTFNSRDFRAKFAREYRDGGCRYSMTGGVLVEIGAATLVPGGRGDDCSYRAATQTVTAEASG